MKELVAAAAAATLIAVSAAALTAALPAQATTFSIRMIYVASGVFDSGDLADVGTATSVHCTNLSGKTATVRVSFFSRNGLLEGFNSGPLANEETRTISTHATYFGETYLNTGAIGQGFLRVQSTESGVFCSAMLVDASGGPGAADVPEGTDLHMVRYNPHPGTVE